MFILFTIKPCIRFRKSFIKKYAINIFCLKIYLDLIFTNVHRLIIRNKSRFVKREIKRFIDMIKAKLTFIEFILYLLITDAKNDNY